MPEQLLGPDGKPVDLDAAEQQFTEAMAAPANGDRPDYPAPPRKDEEPPFGRKADGTPRLRRAGPGRGNRDEKARTARSVPAAPRAKSAREPLAPKDRRKGVDAVMQLTAGVLLAFPSTRADAAALAMHQDPMADAIVATAEADEKFARALDRLLDTGPYAALVMATVPFIGQVLVNHGALPKGTLGTEDPAKLRGDVEQALEEKQAEPAAA
jgi:hypothetical protein